MRKVKNKPKTCVASCKVVLPSPKNHVVSLVVDIDGKPVGLQSETMTEQDAQILVKALEKAVQ